MVRSREDSSGLAKQTGSNVPSSAELEVSSLRDIVAYAGLHLYHIMNGRHTEQIREGGGCTP